MQGNRKLIFTDNHGNITETTEQIRNLEIWLGFTRYLLRLALILLIACIR